MSNEEFQRIVLEKLSELEKSQERLEKGQKMLEKGQEGLEKSQRMLEKGQEGLEKGQRMLEKGREGLKKSQKMLEKGQEGLEKSQERLEKGLNVVISQTADLTEFKYDVIKELAEIKSTLSRVEININKRSD